MKSFETLPEPDQATKLEAYLSNLVPDDWTDGESLDFARKYAPLIMEQVNAAIREEETKRNTAELAIEPLRLEDE